MNLFVNRSNPQEFIIYHGQIVDIKEGFWHTFICPTFNRKLKFKKNIFHFQLLLAESSNLTKSSSDNAQISGLMISKFFTVNF